MTPEHSAFVQEYLAKNIGVPPALVSHDALAAIMREPRAGLRELFRGLGVFPADLDHHANTLSAALAARGTKAHELPHAAPLRHEGSPEAAKAEAAVEEAVKLGIVREEIFPATSKTTRVGYLLSSSHYGTHDYDPSMTPEDTKQSQAELFRLTHLLVRHGVRGPMHVEGREHGRTYRPFAKGRATVDVGDGRALDMYDPEAQRHLFDHPDALRTLMDEHQRQSRTAKIGTPVFYHYAAGMVYEGAHSAETERQLAVFDTWLTWHDAFRAKWSFFFKTLRGQNEGDTVELKIGTGWDQNGAPLLQLAGTWITAKDVVNDMSNYLQFADLFQENDEIRETDMANYLLASPEGSVPMAFAGKGHEFMLVERLRQAMEVRVLTPMSSVRDDKLRRTLPINDPRCGLLNVDIVRKVTDAARNLKPRGA